MPDASQTPNTPETIEVTLEDGTKVDGATLLPLVERLERLDEQRVAVNARIRSAYEEVEGKKFDKTVVKALLKNRKADQKVRSRRQMLLSAYEIAIGMSGDQMLPLGSAASDGAQATEAALQHGNDGLTAAEKEAEDQAAKAAAPEAQAEESNVVNLDIPADFKIDQKAAQRGAADYIKGVAKDKNPFKQKNKNRSWDSGWATAQAKQAQQAEVSAVHDRVKAKRQAEKPDVNTPDTVLESFRTEGHNAYESGKSLEENPHSEGTDAWQAWVVGYNTAAEADKKEQDARESAESQPQAAESAGQSEVGAAPAAQESEAADAANWDAGQSAEGAQEPDSDEDEAQETESSEFRDALGLPPEGMSDFGPPVHGDQTTPPA